MAKKITLPSIALALLFLLAACSPTAIDAITPQESSLEPTASARVEIATEDQEPLTSVPDEEKYRIVTLLPQDAIPAIDNPQFLSASESALSYRPDELVMGVAYNGESRAYSVGMLSSHEIVNDTVGGRKIAVTW